MADFTIVGATAAGAIPPEMAAVPGLELQFGNMMQQVGDFLGLGRDLASWSTEDRNRVKDMVWAGYDQFLSPLPLNAGEKSHVWSFLSPIASLALVANTWEYAAPANFGSLKNTFYYGPSVTSVSIRVTSPSLIRRQREMVERTSDPTHVAVEPVELVPATGQRHQFIFWPTPGTARTLEYSYNVNAVKPNDPNVYLLGGGLHSQTILESSLAIADLRMNDTIGIHDKQFKERLAASIRADLRIGAQTLGYNSNLAEETVPRRSDVTVTYP